MPFVALRDPRDRVTVAVSLLPWLLVVAWPSPVAIALGVWWLGNTCAHQAVHRRLFVHAGAERLFSFWLSAGLGVPQRLWRQRHLAHHAQRPHRWRFEPWLLTEAVGLSVAHLLAAFLVPGPWATVYLPGLAGGLLLAHVHGHYEHAGGTTSCRLRWWNVLLLNDGWHEEHHEAPKRPWWQLGTANGPAPRMSPLPPPVRWLAALAPANLLDRAERLVLGRPWLQRRVLAAHRAAFAAVLPRSFDPARIVIVGGGLFPRSAILLRERFPGAVITVLDQDARHLAAAAPLLPPDVVVRHAVLRPGDRLDADLVVLPLALRGARAGFLAAPPAPCLLMHDWWWRGIGEGRVVAWWLGKRVRLLQTAARVAPQPA